MHWYAIHTKPNQEDLVKLSLQRLGLETFCPQFKRTRVIRRKQRTRVSPLFPGYLFVRFNLDTHYRAVNYAPGVQRLVAFGPTPAQVDESLIESLRSRHQNGYISVPASAFTPGQKVRILGGLFQGLEAIFEQEMSDHQRVVVLLRALSYQARVTIALEDVVNL